MNNFLYKNNKPTFISLLLVFSIVLSIGLYYRFFPLYTYIQGDSKDKASVIVLTKLRSQVKEMVDQNHPNLPDSQKGALYKKTFDELLHKESKRVRHSIDQLTQKIEADSNTQENSPYLLASDSYYYYNLTENILQTGKLGGPKKASKYLNELMLAPEGHFEPLTLHPFVGFAIYKVVALFQPDVSLSFAVSLTPLLITTLALISFFYLSQLLKICTVALFSGSVFFILAPIFVKRSTFSWYDNDPYNVLFPLLILNSFFFGLCTLKKQNTFIISACCTALLILTYSFFWQGWVFMFSIIFASGVSILLYNHLFLKQRSTQKPLLTFLGIIFIGSFICISLSFGINEFFTLFKEGWIALKNFLKPQLAPWPDLYISVGELKKASLSSIIELTGGPFFFIISLFGLITTLLKSLRKPEQTNPFIILTLCIFTLGSLVITTGAQRFAILCLVPLSIGFLLGLNVLIDLTSKQKSITKLILLIVIASLVVYPIHTIHGSVRTLLNPIYNSTWEKSLLAIKEKTPENSIVNTWWSPGHFIKSTANRRVTFDGATINKPQAYWMANIFLSQTEHEALGIIRMLNTSANQAADYLLELGVPLSTAVLILKEITKLPAHEAQLLLTKGFKNASVTKNILNLTHAQAPPSYVLVYKEFVDSNLQLPFIGNWNFKEIEKINADPNLIKKVPKRNSEAYVQFLWDLAGGRYKYSGVLTQLNKSEDILTFENNVTVNLKNMDCTIASPKYGTGKPFSLFYLEDGVVKEKIFNNASLHYSVVLYKQDQNYYCVLMDRILANSILTKLYFFEANGLKYFKQIIRETDLTGQTDIHVYEVDWKSFYADTNLKINTKNL